MHANEVQKALAAHPLSRGAHHPVTDDITKRTVRIPNDYAAYRPKFEYFMGGRVHKLSEEYKLDRRKRHE
jgi:hypothetical protein